MARALDQLSSALGNEFIGLEAIGPPVASLLRTHYPRWFDEELFVTFG